MRILHFVSIALATTVLVPLGAATSRPTFDGAGLAVETGDCFDPHAVVSIHVTFDYEGTPEDYPVAEWVSSQPCIGATWFASMPTTCTMRDGGFTCIQTVMTTRYLLDVDTYGNSFHIQIQDYGVVVNDLVGSFVPQSPP